MPSHYLNQCWNIVNSNPRNKFQWNPRRNSFIFILENVFENVVCEMASIWSRPQWVNLYYIFIRTNPTVLSCDTNQVFFLCVQAVSLRYRPYEVTMPLGWASEGDWAPQFKQRIQLFLRCHLTVPHGSGQSPVMVVLWGSPGCMHVACWD